MLFFIGISIAIALIGGSICGLLAMFRTNEIRKELSGLRRDIFELRVSHRENSDVEVEIVEPLEPVQASTAPASVEQPEEVEVSEEDLPDPVSEPVSGWPPPQSEPNELFVWLKTNWMVALGGFCVALAGIFMVRYSIERGLLSPAARVTMGVITGFGLHAAAEWFRRKTPDKHPSLAALAGGASITLYAAFLAGLNMYQLFSPTVAFVLLAVVSLATMALALWYGPVLATMGILGAYIVPFFVSTGSGNITLVLVYSLIITVSSLLLMHYIHRTWLFVGTLLGALGWWVIAMLSGEAEEFRSFYLVLVAYVLLAVKDFNWQLNKPWDSKNEAFTALIGSYRLVFDNWPVQLGILVIGIASAFDLYTDVFSTTTNIAICVLIAIVFITSRLKSRNAAMPWAYLVMLLGAWWLAHVEFKSEGIAVSQVHGIQAYTIQKWVAWMGVLFCGFAIWNSRQQLNNHGWWSIACLAPVLWLVVAHQITGDVYPDYYWASWLGFLGLLLHYFAARHLAANPRSPIATWPILASHFGFAVAMAMLFRDASLTLALATQLITLAMISRQYQISFLSWMIKIVLAVIVVRLTLNPWLFTYPPYVHWSLWSYGGATVCCAIATWLLRADERMRKWLEIGSLHLLVLTLAAETRYWLYDGAIFTHHYGLMEASINFPLWAGLSLVYRWRSMVGSHLAVVYKWLSRILLIMTVVNYLALLLLLDSNRGIDQIASTPIWNLLLLTFGVPVILFALIYRFHETKFKRMAGIATGVSLFIFLSVEIRHLWQGQLISFNSTSSGEQYTYSVVWLLMAIAAIILGSWKNRTQLYKGGTILLALVIAKLFLVDLSDLVGLWRVASFMGLGLSLLGLAYLHRFVGDRKLDSTAG